MKKIVTMMMAVMLVLSVGTLFASAKDTAEVYVTITDKDGKLAVAAEKVTVTDIDGDNALTVNDALYAAHEQFYDGGAAAGYATETTLWGLSLTKLWGTANGGSYGYMVNNASAWSMADPVKTDDYVAAYIYTDTKDLSDKYAYFDKHTADVSVSFDLTLNKADFDRDWNPVTLPIAGAEITVDGKPTGIFTDENGVASISFTTNGKHVVSAIASNQVIVPPVCVANVTGCQEATPDEAAPTENATEPFTEETKAVEETVSETISNTDTKDSATKDAATKDTSASSSTPATGDSTHLYLWLLLTIASLSGALGTVVIYKKRYEK